ncbi:MAG TPA: DUF6496 domain-containing protein [Kofleriaceae bacterium]|jgi:hypothetical protein|nr:DUF6496 domain-containing protein [Kofleriaceae bacterium]
MPEARTLKAAKAKLAAGDSPSTAAGEFVREEIDHVREGKHGARSTKQAIAIGLSKARRAGVRVQPGPTASARTKRSAQRELDEASGKRAKRAPSATRSRATEHALQREPHAAGSHEALSAHAHQVARMRGPAARRASARKAARTRAHHR